MNLWFWMERQETKCRDQTIVFFGRHSGGACSNLDWKISPVSLVIQVECKEQPSLLCWVVIPNLVAVCQTVLNRGGLVDTYRHLLVAGDPARLGSWSSSTAKCHVMLSYQAWAELNRSKHSVVGYARYSPHLLALAVLTEFLHFILIILTVLGTGIRGLMRGMATLPQGNQELLVVRDKVGRPQVNLAWASPWNVIFSLQCFNTVGWATRRASGLFNKLDVGLLVVMIWLEVCTTYSSSCHHLHHPLILIFWFWYNSSPPSSFASV